MNLINTDGLFWPVSGFPLLDPSGIAPLKAIKIENQGSSLHSVLAEKRERIALQHDTAGRVADLVLVAGAFTHPGNEDLPNPSLDTLSHGMCPAIPAIEITHHADPLSVRSPDGETDPRMSINLRQVRSEFFVDL